MIVLAAPEQSSASDPVRDTSNWIVLLFTIGISCLYLAPGLDKQWYPWDDGGLAETAQRTLAGQLPHRDFVDTYTGGLSFFDAGVFWLFGTDLLWLRIAMIPFFILFVVATFEVARRLTPPLIAGLLTVTMVVWTVPNYSAAMPVLVQPLLRRLRGLDDREVARDRVVICGSFIAGFSGWTLDRRQDRWRLLRHRRSPLSRVSSPTGR